MKNRLSSLRKKWWRQTPAAPPQLRMRFAQNAPPPLEALETPYRLRRFREGDEIGWAALLNGRGELGSWTHERLGAEISSFLVADTQHFVLCDLEIVSGAGVYERSSVCWEIGWVATSLDHRGRGLARRRPPDRPGRGHAGGLRHTAGEGSDARSTLCTSAQNASCGPCHQFDSRDRPGARD